MVHPSESGGKRAVRNIVSAQATDTAISTPLTILNGIEEDKTAGEIARDVIIDELTNLGLNMAIAGVDKFFYDKFGISGASVGEDVNIDVYNPPDGGGGITDSIKIQDKKVTFGHGARHLEGSNITATEVNNAIAKEIAKIHPETGQFYKGRIIIKGKTIEYSAYGVQDGIINIGTYYIVK